MRRNYALGNIKIFLLLLGCIYTVISIIMGEFLLTKYVFITILVIEFLGMIFLPPISFNRNDLKGRRKFKLDIKVRYYLYCTMSIMMIITFILGLIFTITFLSYIDDSIYILYPFILCLLSHMYIYYMYKIFLLLDLNSYYVRPFIYENVKIKSFNDLKKMIKSNSSSKWSSCSFKGIKFGYLVNDNNLYLTINDKMMSKELFALYYVSLFKELDNFVKEKNIFDKQSYRVFLVFYLDDANQELLRYVISSVKQRKNFVYIPCAYVFSQKRLYIVRQRIFYKLFEYYKLKKDLIKIFNLVG